MAQAPVYRNLRQWRLWLSGLVGSRYDGLYNFHVVAPDVLYRCGQPRVRDLEFIRDNYGLKTVVCARGGTRHPLRGRWFRLQRAFCERAGIRLEHMPFSDSDSADAEIFERFLRIVADPANYPVLVHCEQGLHRTGVLSAAYRVAVQRWPIDRALRELDRLGYDVERAKRRPLLDAFLDWARTTASKRTAESHAA